MGEDTIDKSAFNEASYKMMRLHECQRRINHVNQDLLKYYHELSGYGYKIKKTEIENLIVEVWGKLDTLNKKKAGALRKLMDDYLDAFPIFKIIKLNNASGGKNVNRIDEDNFKKYRELLIHVHLYVNELLEEAGYSTFTVEADDGDPYN